MVKLVRRHTSNVEIISSTLVGSIYFFMQITQAIFFFFLKKNPYIHTYKPALAPRLEMNRADEKHYINIIINMTTLCRMKVLYISIYFTHVLACILNQDLEGNLE